MAELKAILKAPDSLEIWVRKGYWASKTSIFRLYENGVEIAKLTPLSTNDHGDWQSLYLPIEKPFIPGNEYEIADAKNEFVPVDLYYLATTAEFDQKYRYDEPLGAIYTPERTTFRAFSPLASELYVKLRPRGEKIFRLYPMERLECGVYQATVEGDLDQAAYLYAGRINGRAVSTVDPYAFSCATNTRLGYVIDPQKILAEDSNKAALPPFANASQAVIYEASVRDMTARLNWPDKGTFNALAKTGQKLENTDLPVGLDYVKSLGITHIQLLPVLDFQTVDEEQPTASYNWGYDPLLYFAPEGSYSSNPNDPYARVKELRRLVSAFHANGIRVNFDVVYNHVFDAYSNPLEILCPGYYFRYNDDGTPSNGTFCGNDIESRHYMVGRLIKDSLKHCVEFFGADGFRFDLMGTIDRQTLLQAQSELVNLDKNLMFYGEGWDMPTALPSGDKSIIANAFAMTSVGFFCDRFRDTVKGATDRNSLGDRGYATGASEEIDDFKFVYAACCLDVGKSPLFENPLQPINYLECHDNSVLYDKLKISLPQADENELLARLKMLNAVVLLAAGIPFIHAGQEIGQTKFNNDNSFDAGDQVNGFDYGLLSQRPQLYGFIKDIIAFRKTHPDFLFTSKDELKNVLSFQNIDRGALMIRYGAREDGFYYVFINPQKESISYTFPYKVTTVFNENGQVNNNDFTAEMVVVNGLSVTICHAKSEDSAQG